MTINSDQILQEAAALGIRNEVKDNGEILYHVMAGEMSLEECYETALEEIKIRSEVLDGKVTLDIGPIVQN